ncbi:MAG: hypothetical protein EAX95_14845, partial [Candidatus Thorarchaeota archaeon]|nr:hypothetical protein [Candidatus Thorarchaeota archaeon]
EWKARKGIPSAVLTVESTVEDVARNIQEAYKWEPAPTYVVLFGDVEAIPTNYDMIHEGRFGGKPIFEDGYIASDLGYFNVEGNSYFPDMIYSRISVDTVEQAEAIVSKTIQYEIDPPADPLFYNSMLLAGTFEDKPPFKNGIEDAAFPFIYHLERIRHYLEDNHEYAIHFNYSCAGLGTEPMPEYFHAPLTSEISSIAVRNSLPADYEWLWAYDHPLDYDEARLNITKNINEGRFLVLYYSHGGSKNMIYPVDVSLFPNGYDRNDRDIVEGWQTPYFNTSYFSDLTNGDLTPLVVSIACNTGWFDGETDEGHMDIAEFDPNPFEDYENECFAENITRIEEGGAVAAISASRPSYGLTCGDLLDGIVGAFWPGFLGYQTEPIYEMGSALYFGKLYMASKWLGLYTRQDVIRTTFEEFHLFGDPETQLWTEDPSSFSVSHPISISTSGTQRFVVTVRDLDSEPVNYAKVCIQQGTHVYQVGYTNQAGQVIFDVNPADTPASLNVTVTKHNFRPYLGEILVKPSSAEVTLSEYSGFPLDTVTFTLSGFDANYPIRVYMDDSWVATIYSGTTAYGLVPIGPEGHVNVWVAHYSPYDPADLWEPVAVNRYYRLSTELHPDPYIYSLNDRSTWHLADGNKVWNNPCITLYEGDNPATEIRQNSEYDVKVKVYNRGNADAPHTTVSLYYAPFGGGVSWTRVGWQLVSIDMSGEAEASIKWRPLLPNTAYLQVVLETTGEKEEDELNNVGWESVGVVPLCSPGATSFQVRNPTDQTEYIFIKVKQQGDYDDVWNATILDYSSQAMSTGESETVTFFVDPQTETGLQEGHRFTTEIYVNCELLGGMEFNATQAVCLPSCCPCCCLCLLIIGGLIIAGVAVWYRRRN